MKHNIIIPDDILEILQEIANNTKGYRVYLGGGFCRDLYVNRGLQPKDIDVFFVPLPDQSEYFIHDTPALAEFKYRMDTTDSISMYKRGVVKLIGFNTPSLSTNEMQFIIYRKFLTGMELAQDMDAGINQVMYDVLTKEFIFSEKFLLDHEIKVIKLYHQFEKHRMIERYNRMQAKFPDYLCIGKPFYTIEDLQSNYNRECVESSGHFVGLTISPEIKCSSGY